MKGLVSTTKPGFGIGFEFFTGTCQGEDFDEFIIAQKAISFARDPTGTDVLDSGTGEDECPTILRNTFQRVLDYEALNMKLAKAEFLYGFVITKETQILVNFTFGILFLRRVHGLIRDLDKPILQHKGIFALHFSNTWLAL